jgi:hypothetical protein
LYHIFLSECVFGKALCFANHEQWLVLQVEESSAACANTRSLSQLPCCRLLGQGLLSTSSLRIPVKVTAVSANRDRPLMRRALVRGYWGQGFVGVADEAVGDLADDGGGAVDGGNDAYVVAGGGGGWATDQTKAGIYLNA